MGEIPLSACEIDDCVKVTGKENCFSINSRSGGVTKKFIIQVEGVMILQLKKCFSPPVKRKQRNGLKQFRQVENIVLLELLLTWHM